MRHYIILFFSVFALFYSCSKPVDDSFPTPQIKAGIAKLSGKLKSQEKDLELTLVFVNPVTADVSRLNTIVSEDESFAFEVPVECNVIGYILPYGIAVLLIPDEEVTLELTYDSPSEKVKVDKNSSGLNTKDMLNLSDWEMHSRFHTPNSKSMYGSIYALNHDDFVKTSILMMEARIKYALSGSTLTKKGERFISNEFKLIYLGSLLKYSEYVSLNYRNFKTEEEPDDFTPQEPGKSYYNLLKYFNLDDPQYLYNETYKEVLQRILSNDTLGIYDIGDTPIAEWLDGVKSTMAEMIGSDSGLFYDMLTANVYARQLNMIKPLSEKQKENIKNYFKSGEIGKILLAKNEKVTEQDEENQQYFSLNINETPTVPKEELLKTIISKYKGKVILVDYWATWCGPCLEAMHKFRDVKSELKDENIVYLYISNTSSPKKLWEEQIQSIRGEQYYLTREEWVYILDSHDFSAIPTYQLYDTSGNLKYQTTGYPGNETMKTEITKLFGNL